MPQLRSVHTVPSRENGRAIFTVIGWPWSAWRLAVVRRAAAGTVVLAAPMTGTPALVAGMGLGGLILSGVRPGYGPSQAGPEIRAGRWLLAFQRASCGVDAGDPGWQVVLAGELAQQVGGGLGGHAEAGAERVTGECWFWC
jgi:hypothetical protein